MTKDAAQLWTDRVRFLETDPGLIMETAVTGQSFEPSVLVLSNFSVRLYRDFASMLKTSPAEQLVTDLFQLPGYKSGQQ